MVGLCIPSVCQDQTTLLQEYVGYENFLSPAQKVILAQFSKESKYQTSLVCSPSEDNGLSAPALYCLLALTCLVGTVLKASVLHKIPQHIAQLGICRQLGMLLQNLFSFFFKCSCASPEDEPYDPYQTDTDRLLNPSVTDDGLSREPGEVSTSEDVEQYVPLAEAPVQTPPLSALQRFVDLFSIQTAIAALVRPAAKDALGLKLQVGITCSDMILAILMGFGNS